MAIVIDVKEAGLSEAMKHLDQFEEALRRVEAAMKGLGGASMGAGTSASRAARSAQNSSAGHPSATGVRSPAAQQPKAKAYNNYRYWDAMNRASGGRYATQRGGSAAAAFAEAQLAAQAGDARALARMGPLSRALAKGQGGSSGGGSVASGIAQGALALSTRGGPWVAAATTAVVSLTALAAASLAASEKLNKLGQGAYGSGSSIVNSGVAQRLERGGVNVDAIMGAVMQDGMARALASQMGIDLSGGPLGNIDKVSTGLKFAKAIMNQSNEADAIRLANMFGNPDAAKLWYQRGVKPIEYLRNGDGSDFSFEEHMKAMEIQARWDKILDKFEKVITRTLLPIAEFLLPDNEAEISKRQQQLETFEKVIKSLFPFGGLGVSAGKIAMGEMERKAKVAHNKALEENTAALSQNTRALKTFRETLGGGVRVQKAIPKKLDGIILNNDTYRAALASGVI